MSISREITSKEPSEIVFCCYYSCMLQRLNNSFYYIVLYQIFCPLSTKSNFKCFSDSTPTMPLQEKSQVLYAVCRKCTQKKLLREDTLKIHLSQAILRDLSKNNKKKFKTHTILHNQFRNQLLVLSQRTGVTLSCLLLFHSSGKQNSPGEPGYLKPTYPE